MAAIRALGRIGDKRAVKLLLDLLPGNYIDMKKHILIALGRIGDVSFVKPLLIDFPEFSGEIVDPIEAVGEDALPVLEEYLANYDQNNGFYSEIAVSKIKKALAEEKETQ